jgi:hypothetical protein
MKNRGKGRKRNWERGRKIKESNRARKCLRGEDSRKEGESEEGRERGR